MPSDLIGTVTLVIDKGQKTNSYKLALLRALVSIAETQPAAPLQITRMELAEQFVRRYWPLTLLFRIRQATVPDKDPVVMRLIRNEQKRLRFSDETRLDTYRQRWPDDYKRLVGSVARTAFDDVIPRFHTVLGSQIEPSLFGINGEAIVIESSAHQFLRSKARTVDLLALAGWVAFTEQFTSAPRLFEKIEGVAAIRRSLKAFRTFLSAMDGQACFYCGVNVPPNTPVDHVIPWAFVAEDKIWNLVLACHDCNARKSSRIAGPVSLKRLVIRNEDLLMRPASSLPIAIRRDLAEWRARGLGDHIHMMSERCQMDGFREWSPTDEAL